MPAFTFQRFAGSKQVRIKSFEDLVAVKYLPEAHWVATACPTEGLNCDRRYLELLDTDHNGRIRAHEIITAIGWLEKMIAVPENVIPGKSTLELAHLSEHAAELKSTALQILDNLGATDRARITLEDVRKTKEIFDKAATNGDGIISPSAVKEPEQQRLINEMLAVFPGAIDISGEKGVDLATIDAFDKARLAAIEWRDRGAPAEQLKIAALITELAPKIDEYFLECRLVAAQPDAKAELRLKPDAVQATIGDPALLKKALDVLPIAAPDPQGILHFDHLHRGALYEKLLELKSSEDKVELTEQRWLELNHSLKVIHAWQKLEVDHPILALGVERLRAIEQKELESIRAACRRDLEIGKTLVRITDLERLILYQRWLFVFVNNFISMPHLFAGDQRAMFEQGTLIMSGREFSLAIRVPDRETHAALAADAGMYIMYIQVYGGRPEVRFDVAVPVTAGSSNNLWVGKNGIFRTVAGDEYDAKIVQLVTQPVSIWEALTQPFTKVGAFLARRWERFSKRLDSDIDQLDKKPVVAAPSGQSGNAAAAAGIGGVLVSSSVAFAAVGSALAFITTQVQEMLSQPLLLLYALLIVVGILFGPIALFSWFRLRSRNLAIVLEAAGWALNDRLRMTGRLGRLYSRRPPVRSVVA